MTTTTTAMPTHRELVQARLTACASDAAKLGRTHPNPAYPNQAVNFRPTPPNTHNFWPDLPLVKLTIVDPANPQANYRLGLCAGEGLGVTYYGRSMPMEVRKALATARRPLEHLHDQATMHGFVTFAGVPGQTFKGDRNLLVVFAPLVTYQGVIERPGLIAEVGCAHDLRAVKLGNCYHESTCQTPGCNYSFTVDSGD